MSGSAISLLAERHRTTLYVQQDHRGRSLLKILNEEHPTQEDLVRFYNDLEITRGLRIPGVRRGLRKDRVNGRHALVLEYVEGEALGRQLVEREADLPVFLELAIQIAQIIGGVHEQNIIHRDIKPENLIFDAAHGAVKLIDFGISSRIDVEAQHLGNPAFLEGTLVYISPEQTGRMNRVVDYRSDLYSLGASFYQLLTGSPPFAAEDPMQLIHQHLAKVPVPPHERNPVVPETLSDIVLKLLAKNAEDRYQSALGLERDLQRCLTSHRRSGRIQPFAIAQQDFSGRFKLSQKLYGRERELQVLMEAFHSTSRGGVEMVLVRGYAGVGKSALVHEVHKPMTEIRGYFIEGKFDALRRSIPYYAPLQAFDGLVDILLTEGDERLLAWRDTILDAVGHLGNVLATLVPTIVQIIGSQPEVPELNDEEARNRLDYVMQSFIRAVSGPEHPLVLFIDDLQWADLASLDLLKALMTDRESSHILLIVAYRDNEVVPGHPVATMIEDLHERGVSVRAIEVGSLSHEHIGRLIGDALGVTPAQAASLVDLVEEKTEGNAFAVAQCLRSISEAQALWFDHGEHRWRWDIDRIRALGIPDSVVDLLSERIRKLAPETQEVLQMAACVGNLFDLQMLSFLHEQAPRETLDDLWPAITERLIVPGGSTYRLLGAADIEACADVSFRFVHDRVQQTAYSMIEEKPRQAIHLRIGNLLRARADGRTQRLFDTVNHLNFAAELLTSTEDRRMLAELDLEAGRRARQAAAYVQALSYLRTGMELLPEDAWQSDYELALALWTDAAQTAYAIGDFDQVNALAEEILAHARTVLDTLPARNIMLRSAASRESPNEVIALGQEALRLLGVRFPAQPGKADLFVAYLRTRLALAGKRIESLPDQPEMTDEVKRAAALIIECMLPSAFRAGSMLFPVLMLRLVWLSMRYGNTPASVYGYGSYGIMLCGVMRNIEDGYRMGKMSLRLAERMRKAPRMGDALFIFNVFIRHWKEPLRRCIKPMRQAYQVGLEAGRSFEAVAAACYYLLLMQASGKELAEVELQLQEYHHLLVRNEAGYLSSLLWQMLDNLLGRAKVFHRLSGERYDEAEVETRFASHSDKSEVAFFCTFKIHLCVLAGEHEEAVRCADEAEPYLEAITGMAHEALLRFYAALARFSLYQADPAREDLLRKTRKTRSLLRKWAKHGPDNYLHKHLLVEAEYARARGQTAAARRLYERAVTAARASKILPEEALAFERAGGFFHDIGESILADSFLQAAMRTYGQWGAKPKVQMLRARHLQPSGGEWGETITSSIMSNEHTGSSADDISLDLISLMKASRTISAEIVMDRLLASLIEIVVENAGAQRGALLLMEDDELRVQAQSGLEPGTVSVMQGIPLLEARNVCEALIRYVVRTRQHRVVEDAGEDVHFRHDPYVRESRALSMLCMPIKHQGKLTGVLYLENSLVRGAFTPALIEILEILASQAAVSLENARLYGSQVELSDALRRFVPDEFLKSLGRESIAEVQLGDSVQKEMSILFSDMRGFTTLVEGMSPEENIGFINGYLRYMEPCIGRHGGFVDSYVGDAIMALFEGTANNAVTAAVEMLVALGGMNEQRRARGMPGIGVGIGVNTGMLTLGTIGGTSRIKCGVIGDSVNLASRVESQTKRYAVPLLISDRTYERLHQPWTFHTRIVDKVRVVGRTEPVTLHEVFDADAEDRKQAKLAVASTYARALVRYYSRAFGDAEDLLRECQAVVGEDRVIAMFIERCRRYQAQDPGEAWTGVEDLRYK